MRCFFFWKRLKGSLKNETIIIEGTMRLHSFLVDYREEYYDPITDETKRSTFNTVVVDSDKSAMVVGNGVGISGNISNHEREMRLKIL